MLNQEPDARVWVKENSGLFSCKSFFQWLVDDPGENVDPIHKMIWRVGIPHKVKIFAWLASWRKVNTNDVIQVKRPYKALSPNWCSLCKNDEENIDHLLLHCRFTCGLWSKALKEFDISGVFPKTWRDFLEIKWRWNGNKRKSAVLWRCCCMAIAWWVWKERNNRIFENKELEVEAVWEIIQLYASIWAASDKSFQNLTISEIIFSWAGVIQ